MDKNILYYDPNELRSGVPMELPQAESLPMPLDYGWLDSDGALVLVERKELNDLAGSLRNDHLRDQLEEAKKITNHIWLLVENWPEDLACELPNLSGQWDYPRFLSALYALLYGLNVLGPIPTATPEDSAVNLWTLFEQTRRESLGSGRPANPKWRWTERDTLAESYSRAMPRGIGLGFSRAKALQRLYPSWVDLVGASRLRLQQVEGIGPVLARRIYQFLRRKK